MRALNLLVGFILFSSSALAKDNLLSATADIYTGSVENSVSGSYGYGLSFASFENKGVLEYGIGGSFSSVAGSIYIASVAYGASLAFFDLSIEGLWKPMKGASLSPFMGCGIVTGFALVEMDDPPRGASYRSMGTSVGGKGFIGSDLKWGSRRFRGQVDYVKRKSSDIFGAPTDLDAIAVRAGFFF